MDNLLSFRRSALVYGICLPLAIVLGYFLAQPERFSTQAFVALLLGILSLPILIRWHHPLLILAWNASLIIPFLPGQPSWWMCMSFISLALAVLLRIMTKKGDFVSAPSVTFWVCFLLVVLIVTAKFTGGFGTRVFGSANFGGKRYLYLVSAIVGYFALIGGRIQPEHATFIVVGFFLSGITTAVGDAAFWLGPSYYFVYYLFPSGIAYHQIASEETSLERFAGIGFACQSAIVALLARYGFRGILVWSRPWRLVLLILLVTGSMFGGYRSLLILFLALLAFQFIFEQLFTIRNIAFLTGLLILFLAFVFAFSTKLPVSVQRTLSFLPIPVEENVRVDVTGSSEWRWFMWKTVLPDVPKYIWLGKGFMFSGTDLYLTEEATRRGYYSSYETAILGGNYHNGLLSTIIPLGIWGVIGLAGFLTAAVRVLYLNYRNGDPPLRVANTILISWFCARLLMFLTVYGAFDFDFPNFVGIVGLSLSLNGGVRRKESPEVTLNQQEEILVLEGARV